MYVGQSTKIQTIQARVSKMTVVVVVVVSCCSLLLHMYCMVLHERTWIEYCTMCVRSVIYGAHNFLHLSSLTPSWLQHCNLDILPHSIIHLIISRVRMWVSVMNSVCCCIAQVLHCFAWSQPICNGFSSLHLHFLSNQSKITLQFRWCRIR